LDANQRIQALACVPRRMHFSPLNYFLARFSHLEKSLRQLARLARPLQFPGQARRKAL
jgi:hypothetical protein